MGAKVGGFGRAGARYVRAMFGLCSGYVRGSSQETRMAGGFGGRGQDSNARHTLGECNCRLLDALSGRFRGRGKESNVRNTFGECNCRLLDAL